MYFYQLLGFMRNTKGIMIKARLPLFFTTIFFVYLQVACRAIAFGEGCKDVL
jgi:hypothetical protein